MRTKKRIRGFVKIFKITETNLDRARMLLSDIDIVSSDSDILILYQKSLCVDVQILATELIQNIITGKKIKDSQKKENAKILALFDE